MDVIAITGASGFVGRHLVQSLSARDNTRVRVLVHQNRNDIFDKENVVPIEGDLLESESLNFLEPGCSVVNLAYLRGASREESLQAIDNLLGACEQAGVQRFVHLSTAVVVGRAPEREIRENTPCLPGDEYERLKLELEKYVLARAAGRFEAIILRPTAVFGPGGENLLNLAHAVRQGGMINYPKSCLYHQRRMNLVAVENVVRAIEFLLDAKQNVDQEIFIISDDEEQKNNYRDIEIFLKKRWGMRGYLLPVMPLPRAVLSVLLKLAGRSNTNPSRTYSCGKLLQTGYRKNLSFDAALASFADWFSTALGDS